MAVLGVRRDLKLQVTGDGRSRQVTVEAWAGEPSADTDGVAVIEQAGGLALARIPLCGCGDRGCGNVGIQFRKRLAPDDLPALVALLRTLPWSSAVPSRSDVPRGEGLAALPAPPSGRVKAVVYHGAQIGQDGTLVPVTRVRPLDDDSGGGDQRRSGDGLRSIRRVTSAQTTAEMIADLRGDR